MNFHPLSELFPLMQGREFDELVADIEQNGLREPVWLYDGLILDGRNRWRACNQIGAEAATRAYEGDNPLKFVISLNLHRRHLNESQRAMVAARIATLPQGARTDIASIDAMSQPQAAELMSVGRASLQRAREVLTSGTPGLVAAVEAGEIPVSAAAAIARRPAAEQAEIVEQARCEDKKVQLIARQRDIAKQREAINSGEITLPEGQFDLIVIDPPWPYRDGEEHPDYDPHGRRASNPYPEMSLEEIASIDVGGIGAPDCVLWLWTTHKFMRHAFPLLDSWGFEDRAILTWAKDRMGLGRWLRSQSEFCIMATRGSPTISLTNQTTVLHGPLREHSRKPAEFYSMVEQLCVSRRRIDYFSREPRDGWYQVGNDVRKFA